MFGREPALIAASLAAIAQSVYMLVAGEASFTKEEAEMWLLPVVTILGGWLTRRKVMPIETINQAGMTSNSVNKMADDNRIIPVNEDGIEVSNG